ncbi:hypothetical protein BD626DRAFT_214094 [Schizophyllum amplum]|uniref:Uncharacterized protein n=1 Tax=Schizophyllum amplum TaxID=97359 RepID=A0A550BXT1_9AGAR|nr:hypothetical protein BD626DRAFT_214094 [Auriculariopsis ampla]
MTASASSPLVYLSHLLPQALLRSSTRDTQSLADNFKLVGCNRIALRALMQHGSELCMTIQVGDHSSLPPQRPPGHRHHARAPHPPWPCSASTMTLLRLHYGRVPHPPWLWSFHYGRVPHTPRPCSASIMAVFRLHYGRVPPPPCPCFASTMAV